MISLRLPIEIAPTEQSEQAQILEILEAELQGISGPTGFDPAEEGEKFIVSFDTCVVQGVRH
jgi:hypothetical protein